MHQGQKQMYMFLMFIIFILAFHFCRKSIKRDKELKQQRDDALKRKLEADIIEQKIQIERILQEQEIRRQHDIIDRMKEQSKVCYDLMIFSSRPSDELKIENWSKLNEKQMRNGGGVSDGKSKDKIKSIKKNTTFSEPIIYLFILILIYFLIKAATDIKQHFKEQTELNKTDRRFSLQDYANRRNSKAIIRRKAFNAQTSSMETNNKLTQSFDESRRTPPPPPSQPAATVAASTTAIAEERKRKYRTGTITEPGTPTKFNHLSGKPLIRRCSVPVFLPQIQLLQSSSLRRTSCDIEGDFQPDVKRRVRMLHRH